MTLEQINLLELSLDYYPQMVARIVDVSEVQGAWYDLDEDLQKSDYDRFMVHASIIKPTLQRITDEFLEYKSELIAIENARLAEIARVQDIKDRFNALSDVRMAISKANLNIANPTKELERIIKENDQEMLASLESGDVIANNAIMLENAKNNMDLNIFNKAKEISKGTSMESVQSFFQAFQIRAANPASYINSGLVVRYAIEGFELGDALDTEVKIVNYYNGILILMDKFRESEIANYISLLR